MKATIGYCKPNPSIHPTRAHYRNTEPDPVLNSSAVQKVPPRLLVIPPDHRHMQWEPFQASLGQVKLFGLRMLGTERRGMEQEEAKSLPKWMPFGTSANSSKVLASARNFAHFSQWKGVTIGRKPLELAILHWVSGTTLRADIFLGAGGVTVPPQGTIFKWT